MLFHKAGINKSKKERKLLVHMFTLPFVKQQINLPKMLNNKYKDDNDLSYLLGYDSESEDSVVNWRKRRKRRMTLK
jgi:ectoine hydroxylase-related dioxygenase (phytanoyl-CoA dioxygenase family)